MLNKLQSLANEFTDLHRQDAKLPFDKRHSVGVMLAIRPWDLPFFQRLQK